MRLRKKSNTQLTPKNLSFESLKKINQQVKEIVQQKLNNDVIYGMLLK